ncbi:MAG: AIPR family protein [Synergistaceae bacterium]|nr:AIPR family protein [Synergistaceae bacterium]
MREKILNDIQGEYYQNNYSNDGQRFIAWYLRNIHRLNIIEAKDCITDGPNDKKIDAVYIDDNQSTIYIIQGKFYEDKLNSEPVSEVISSWMHILDLESLQKKANEKLVVKINEISRALQDDYEICFELITDSKLTDQAAADAERFSKFISDNEYMNASFIVVDNEMLKAKYDEALGKDKTRIDFNFTIEPDKCMQMQLNDVKTILAAIPLSECVNIPDIKDGRLFRQNVRQSLGRNNKVNKGIAKTIKDSSSDFFFYHNGITAICKKINFNSANNTLEVQDINVVNGCQSLSMIFACGESAKKSLGYILFKFYEITNKTKTDKITNNTNSQSAVKAIDMRSNDKTVKSLKKTYEHAYPDGLFITKRGEKADELKYNLNHVYELSAFGKQLMAWHSQRPNISYGETKIFDAYFNTLFHKDYKAEDMQALKDMFDAIIKLWEPDNPMGINESLLAMKAYAPYHHLYAISALVNDINHKLEKVPSPSKIYTKLVEAGMLDDVLKITGKILNMAFEKIRKQFAEAHSVFAPANWIKSKDSVRAVNDTINNYIAAFEFMPGGRDFINKLTDCLTLTDADYTDRYSAD